MVSLSRVSIPPLKDTGDRVPSTDSSLINLKGEAGTVALEMEWSGVEVVVVVMVTVSASELCLSMGWSLLLVGEAEACREDCLFILDSRSKLLLVTFVSPGYLVLPLAAKLLLIRYLGVNVRGEHVVM